ncbi:MAG TPA: hypothetical protein VF158_15135 [Longimicrobiales bacterium]
MALPPNVRSLINSANALSRWAHVQDRTAATAPARAAADQRFERLVDPDGVLPPDERARRAEAARRAHYRRMAARSAEVRARRAQAARRATRTGRAES